MNRRCFVCGGRCGGADDAAIKRPGDMLADDDEGGLIWLCDACEVGTEALFSLLDLGPMKGTGPAPAPASGGDA